MCWTRLIGNTGRKKSPSAHHRTTLSGYILARHISTNEKNLLNSNMSSTCLHNTANVGPLTAEIGSGVWGTPANLNGFRVLPSLLQRRRSPEANQTLDMFGRLLDWCTIYTFFGANCPLTEICQVQNSLYVQVLRSPILAALLHGTPAAGVNQTFRRTTTRNRITQLSQTEGATYIRQGGHHVGHRPTF